MSKALNHHNNFFQSMMSDQRIAKAFFETHLPTKIREACCFETLSYEAETFVDSDLRNTITDVLYSIKINEQDAYIYTVVEHFSYVDELTALRTMRYSLAAMERFVEQHGLAKNKPLPLVVPLVFYHGKQRFNAELSLKKLINAPDDWIDSFFNDPVKLINIKEFDDIALLHEHKRRLGIMEYVMKHIFDRNFEMAVSQILMKLNIKDTRFNKLVLKYVLERANINHDKLLKLANDHSGEMGELVMTPKQAWLAEGKLEGRLEGKREASKAIATKMLQMGYEYDEITTLLDIEPALLAKLSQVAAGMADRDKV